MNFFDEIVHKLGEVEVYSPLDDLARDVHAWVEHEVNRVQLIFAHGRSLAVAEVVVIGTGYVGGYRLSPS